MSFTNPFESLGFMHAKSSVDAFPGIKLFTFPDGFQCYSHTSIEETELLYNEIFIQREYLRYLPSLASIQTAVDIGANIGMFTLLAKLENPAIAMYSFEPMKDTYDILARNLKLHQLKNVVASNIAIGAQDHTVRTFTYYPNMAGNSTANPSYKETQRTQMQETFGKERTDWAFTSEVKTAPVRTLSAIIKEYHLSSIDLLKIDTEGDESFILDGIEEAHFKIVWHMAIEIHTAALYQSIQSRLKKLGYILKSDKGLSAFSGITNLYASRP